MLIGDLPLLIRLLLGHFVSDFFLQTSSMIKGKEEKIWRAGSLYLHAGIYAVIVFVASSAWSQWFWLFPALFVSHFLIDGWKTTREEKTLVFIGDQVAHLAVLAVILVALADFKPNPLEFFIQKIWNSPRVLIVILGYFLVLWPVGRLMSVMTDPFRQQLQDNKSRGLELAGLWIGCLERTFLLTFVLFDYPSGVALLLGLKSLFRFGEIKDPANRKETEYILIGTLLSFAFAMIVGLAVKHALNVWP